MEKSKALLELIGIIIADKPTSVQNLMEEYSMEFSENPDEKELTEKLMVALSECNKNFNHDLGRLILDCTLESQYDSFDVKSFFNKTGNSSEEKSGASGGGGDQGILAGIGSAIGGVANNIGSGKRAREEATSKTLQGIYAYKAQLATNERSKENGKRQMVIALLVVLGFVLFAIAFFNNRKQQQTLPALKA